MLFTSPSFLLLFLPISVGVFYLLTRWGRPLLLLWLTLVSISFYGLMMKPIYILLLLGSMTWNYWIGVRLLRLKALQATGHTLRLTLWIGILVDLILLGYFKYLTFLWGNLNDWTGGHWNVPSIALPAGISFFTFTQIAFLVDAYSGKVRDLTPVNFALFVSYFPHLMAGPILHHEEMLPQFSRRLLHPPSHRDFAVGLSVFFFGLFKKVVFADHLVGAVDHIFSITDQGQTIGMIEAWIGAVAYTLELYFDFSGYSDMAIGLSRMFGVALPINFNSPYKSCSIIEFWRRWHMTLSRFLRDYLYIPLGGNRLGVARRYINLLATMLIGGIWHGANWTFLVWGGLHGIYLSLNRMFKDQIESWPRKLAQLVTLMAVIVGWVVFKSSNIKGALLFLRSMFDLNYLALPLSLKSHLGHCGQNWHYTDGLLQAGLGLNWTDVWLIVLLFLIALYGPNTQQIFRRYRPGLDYNTTEKSACSWFVWRPTWIWAIVTSVIGLTGILSCLVTTKVATFLYYKF